MFLSIIPHFLPSDSCFVCSDSREDSSTAALSGEFSITNSDLEKASLHFIYLWRCNGIPEEKIAADASGWARGISKENLKAYAKRDPKNVADIASTVAK